MFQLVLIQPCGLMQTATWSCHELFSEQVLWC